MRSFPGLLALVVPVLSVGCGTVDPGDNFVTPEPRVDESYFFCVIQPQVISASSCASGASGEAGSCHADRSAMYLDPMAETVPPPTCEMGRPVGDVPMSYRTNLEQVRLRVGNDPQSSPIYRRPLGLDSHPRVIFDEGSMEAQLIADWITMGGT